MANAGDGDKRTVATDALLTLGTIIDDTQKRDAIHLAVDPVVAGETLRPGDHVSVSEGIAIGVDVGKGLGIVDPFLMSRVQKGQRFWFVMYPRMVHSLRHVWTHPAFPDGDIAAPAIAAEIDRKAASEKWLRDFIRDADCPGYEEVIGAAMANDNDEYLHFSDNDAHGEIPAEFWDHLEIVTGRKAPARPSYFSCSC